VGLRDAIYSIYEKRLRRRIADKDLPNHVAVMLDGNRRWARAAGFSDVIDGHLAGAERIEDLLEWCSDMGIQHVTLWLLSTDNLHRDPAELLPLLTIIESVAGQLSAHQNPWRVKVVGALDLLPTQTAVALKAAEERSAYKTGITATLAVGYGGRREIADAVRSLLHEQAEAGTSLEELAEVIDVEHIAEHLYTKGQPDPDLVIRTSGEQRLSGFLLWQSAHSEFYFCDALWPDFRRVDFLRALRAFSERHRRYGS
jgi:short-chain Z-isoprenyl diphosphate synthase